MNYIQSLILSVVEGVTEFLPVSSTGHLILASSLLNIPQTDFVKSFEIAIQLGAIASVLFLYKDTLLKKFGVWKNVAAAFVPTMLVGFVLYKFIKNYLLGSSEIVVLSLIAGGVFLIAFEILYHPINRVSSIEKMNLKTSFLIGLIQSVSVIPGVSRAAATIIGGLFLGLDRKTAVEFSFLLAIPTMLAAAGLDLIQSAPAFTASEFGILVVGFIGAFISALVVVKLFVSYIRNNNFIYFGIYRIAIGILFLL